MISVKFSGSIDKKKLANAAKVAGFKSLAHAAAAIRLTAARSIKQGKKASPPGQPPRTRGKRRLKNAIRYAVDQKKVSALIGPDAEIAGNVGKAHEFGGDFRGEHYDRRPFMEPALDKNRAKLPEFWQNSIKS
jgi:hypothetical protein